MLKSIKQGHNKTMNDFYDWYVCWWSPKCQRNIKPESDPSVETLKQKWCFCWQMGINVIQMYSQEVTDIWGLDVLKSIYKVIISGVLTL